MPERMLPGATVHKWKIIYPGLESSWKFVFGESEFVSLMVYGNGEIGCQTQPGDITGSPELQRSSGIPEFTFS